MNEFMRELLFLPGQRSTIAAELDRLHYFVIITTMIGSFGVAAVALYFIVKYRHRRGPGARGSRAFQMPFELEVVLILGLAFLFVLWWWIGIRQYMKIRQPPEDAMEVWVTGKQWMWQFSYPDGRSSNATLYVPARTPVKLILTSRDVIHSFYVPEFRVKQDAVPGRYTVSWFEATEPGEYPILCTEFCGEGHSTMRGRVIALDPADWSQWLDAATDGTTEPQAYEPPYVVYEGVPRQQLDMVTLGERTAAVYGCLRCHTTDGSEHIGPSFGGMYLSTVPLETGQAVIANEKYITESMMDPMVRIHRGYQPVMPSYHGILEPADTAAIVELIRALRDVERRPTTPPGVLREAPERDPLDPTRAYPAVPVPGQPVYPGTEREAGAEPTAPPREQPGSNQEERP